MNFLSTTQIIALQKPVQSPHIRKLRWMSEVEENSPLPEKHLNQCKGKPTLRANWSNCCLFDEWTTPITCCVALLCGLRLFFVSFLGFQTIWFIETTQNSCSSKIEIWFLEEIFKFFFIYLGSDIGMGMEMRTKWGVWTAFRWFWNPWDPPGLWETQNWLIWKIRHFRFFHDLRWL